MTQGDWSWGHRRSEGLGFVGMRHRGMDDEVVVLIGYGYRLLENYVCNSVPISALDCHQWWQAMRIQSLSWLLTRPAM